MLHWCHLEILNTIWAKAYCSFYSRTCKLYISSCPADALSWRNEMNLVSLMQLEFTGQNNTDHHMLTLKKKKKKLKAEEIIIIILLIRWYLSYTLGWEHCLFRKVRWRKLIIQGQWVKAKEDLAMEVKNQPQGEHPLRIHLKKKEKTIKAQPQKIKLIPSR